jgi:hypothetical protein
MCPSTGPSVAASVPVMIAMIAMTVEESAEVSLKMMGLPASSSQGDARTVWTRVSLSITSWIRQVPRIGICRMFRFVTTSHLSQLLLKWLIGSSRHSLTVVLRADPS